MRSVRGSSAAWSRRRSKDFRTDKWKDRQRKKGQKQKPQEKTFVPDGKANLYGWFDGSCEPVNPGGRGGWGIVLKNSLGETVFADGGKLGSGPEMSNNVAEYHAVSVLLELIGTVAAPGWKVVVMGDSKLVINQLSGEWRVNGGLYKPYFYRAKADLEKLKVAGIKVAFEWVRREENAEADTLSCSRSR
jgi:ribonuclease HI